ncbi:MULTISPECIES: hypothetical protein [Pseudomonas]|uniref:Uncharacterized protein n=1 Tax=Pseudomonas peradeniyensis TaxID=2745488 RepID=A0ABT2V682_9PSED|nr:MULTISPECIES: hypothetical protein [Pseudomonas]MCU7237206.1 hypothetical protein [Pseudomonas peradeniyensis]MCU7280654.1 hypothetical protein [Pseudomonas peradeniyensis]QZA52906.1 hypothetical protein K2O50_18065 [Pseudomonas sp. 2hn]
MNVDKTGVLGFEIRAAQNHPYYDASGTDMFASAMQEGKGDEGKGGRFIFPTLNLVPGA